MTTAAHSDLSLETNSKSRIEVEVLMNLLSNWVLIEYLICY